MAARAYWQGQIRLALVSIPVEVYSATRSGASVSFRQIHEPTGKAVKYEKTVPGVGDVDPDEIVKGFEYKKGNYVLLEQDEIDSVKLESKKTLELTQFVEFGDIDPIYYDKPYYVVPADDLAEEAFIVLREALRRSRRVGIGQLAMRGREYMVSLKACGRGLVLETLHYDDELNKASGYFRSIGDAEPDGELLDLATTLIDKKSGKFDASKYHDRYVDALRALIDTKMKNKGRKVEAEETPPASSGGNVIDLMAALKKSLDAPSKTEGGGSAAKGKSAARTTAKKPAGKTAARKRA